jgi:hypothetical protein
MLVYQIAEPATMERKPHPWTLLRIVVDRGYYMLQRHPAARDGLAGALVYPTFMAIRDANQPQNRPQRPSMRVPQYPSLCILQAAQPFFVDLVPLQTFNPSSVRFRYAHFIINGAPSTPFVFRLH